MSNNSTPIFFNGDNFEIFDIFLQNKIFSIFFTSICLLVLINGSNFIDGFNGLLAIHSLIILSIINFINFYFNNDNLLFIGLMSFSCILSFLLFTTFIIGMLTLNTV